MRTLSEFKYIFTELCGKPSLYDKWYVTNNGNVKSFSKYYNYDFKNLDFYGTFLSVPNSINSELLLLFNNKNIYIGYCCHNTLTLVIETTPTFY